MPVLDSAGLMRCRVCPVRVGRPRRAAGEHLSPLASRASPGKVVFNDLHSVLADVKMERW